MTRSKEIADMWYRDRSGMGADALAAIIARETGCDEEREEPEPDWRETYPTPLRLETSVRGSGGSEVTLVGDNGAKLGRSVDSTSRAAAAYAHMVNCVNEAAKLRDASESVSDLCLPWEVEYKENSVCISDHDGHKLMWKSRTAPWESAYECIVYHINKLGRNGVPNCDMNQCVDKLRTGTHVRDKLSIPSLYEAAIEAIEHVAQANWDNRVEAAKAWLGQVVNGTTDQSLADFQAEDDSGR